MGKEGYLTQKFMSQDIYEPNSQIVGLFGFDANVHKLLIYFPTNAIPSLASSQVKCFLTT